jgi:Galactose oxidase, central domain
LTTTTRIISKASSPIPPPRWGHTLTPIQDQNVVLYGGQTIQSETVATTLSDLYVYDCQTQQFSKPIQCDGVERQWHSAAYLPQRQLMIAFGGEAPDDKGKMKTLNQVMVLDTEIMLWYVNCGEKCFYTPVS